MLIDLLVSIVPATITGLLSYLAARHSAKKEIQKLKLQWEHERQQDVDARLSAMLGDVSDFCRCELGYNDRLLSDIMALRILVPAELDECLDQLYESVKTEDHAGAEAAAGELVHRRRPRR